MTVATTTRYTPEYLAEDRGPTILATCIIFLVIETAAMVLMYTARYVARGERTSRAMEVFMTLTYVVCCMKITIVLLMIEKAGVGHHLAALPPSIRRVSLKLSTANQIVCPLTTSFTKLGVLCLLHRILAQSGRWYRHVIRATFVLVALVAIVQVLIPFVNCRPFSKTWNPQGPGTCAIAGLALWRYLSIPNVFTTLIVVGIPVPALSKLHIARPVKLGLVGVFVVCVLGVVAAFMRVRAFLVVDDFRDITFENVKPLCWTIAEAGIYLVAGVMLTLKPLLKKIFKGTAIERWLRSSRGNSGSWESRRFSRRWHGRDVPPFVVMKKTHRSLSNVTAEGVTLGRTEKPAARQISG